MVYEDQSGYFQGRYTGDNKRTVSDIIHSLKFQNFDGIILLIDFEKAFNSVNWNFMNKTLTSFHFGPQFQKWVNKINKQ